MRSNMYGPGDIQTPGYALQGDRPHERAVIPAHQSDAVSRAMLMHLAIHRHRMDVLEDQIATFQQMVITGSYPVLIVAKLDTLVEEYERLCNITAERSDVGKP